jgi:hypothetical protein
MMSLAERHRGDSVMLTDGGIETRLIYEFGCALPEFAAPLALFDAKAPGAACGDLSLLSHRRARGRDADRHAELAGPSRSLGAARFRRPAISSASMPRR